MSFFFKSRGLGFIIVYRLFSAGSLGLEVYG